jgi:translocation and assembly module TamB
MKQPNIKGSATLQNLKLADELFPQAQMDLSSMGNTLTVGLKAGRNLDVTGQINTAVSGYPFTARVSFVQYPLERVAKLQNATFTATGTADLSGNLKDQNQLKGNGRIETAEIQAQKMNFRSKNPFTFDFDSSRLRLSDMTLTGQSTLVNVSGTIGLTAAAPLKLDVDGQLDVGLITAEYPEYTTSGTVNVKVSVGGTLKNPDVQGSATLNNASLSRSGIFASVAGLNGKVNFDRDRITVSDFQGQVGGGQVHAQGTAFLRDNTVQGMNIEIDATGVRLRGRPLPEGLRTVVNANLILTGTLASPLLEGNVQIQNLAFRSNFEDFLAILAQENLKGNPSALDKLRLGLHIEGGKNITIQNQLATVEARVDIDWKGTVDQPSITGHVEASGGTLTFQGNRYTVTRGNIDFVDPFHIQPIIDLEAESQIRDYRVILSVTGKGNNPKLALRSDPPLPELEIVSLMAGGRTREEIAQQSNYQKPLPTSEQVFQSGAATILTDLLQQKVGSRLGLLNGSKVRFEPFQVGAQGSTSNRITLSQQVTKDLAITYSQDLSSNRQQVITIEYFVTRNTSVVATRDELGNLGVDLRHRTRIK